MKNTVAIIGSHPVSRAWFDFSRNDCDVWVFNEAPKQDWCKRYDSVFQMHSPVIFRSEQNRNDAKHYEWLKEQRNIQIVMQDDYDDIPASVKFPLDEIVEKCLKGICLDGDGNTIGYFTSSVSYALALAIHLGYTVIEMYGVEMETHTEYKHQRDGVTFWIGFANGKGITIKVYSSNIMISPLYGYEGDIKIPMEDFEARIAALTPVCDQYEAQYKAQEAIVNKLVTVFGAYGLDPKNIVTAIQEQVKLGHAFGVADGTRQENERYLKKMKQMIVESGEYCIVMQEYEQATAALGKKRNEQLAVVEGIANRVRSRLSATPTKARIEQGALYACRSLARYIIATSKNPSSWESTPAQELRTGTHGQIGSVDPHGRR